MITLDGAAGEGGGQILRSALALSILTGKPFEIQNIRAGRSKPGLQPQHLKAVDAAAAISKAQVQGAQRGSTQLAFVPGTVHSGRYQFDIGTAGSTSLVLQTVLLPLSRAASASTVIISGGTHVPGAPTYHYLEMQWLPTLRRLGYDVQLSLEQAGFYPQGGGRITATIRPAGETPGLQLTRRGQTVQIRGISAVANLDASIAERQKRQAVGRLHKYFDSIRIKVETLKAVSKGTVIVLLAQSDPDDESQAGFTAQARLTAQACYSALGERGKPAERVADEAVDAVLAFMDTPAVMDEFLADQLLLPLALAGTPSCFTTRRVSRHLLTNASVLRLFLPARIHIQGELDQPGTVSIEPVSDPEGAR